MVKPGGQLIGISILNGKVEVLIPDTDNLRNENFSFGHDLNDEDESLDENSTLNNLQECVNNSKVAIGSGHLPSEDEYSNYLRGCLGEVK